LCKALLLIDIQNDYFPGGRMELAEPDKALRTAEAVLKRFREMSLPVIHIQHINVRAGATFFLPGTEGCLIHERLAPEEGEEVIVKHEPNGFFNTRLGAVIKEKQISELVVCGMMTHMCVDTTVRAAKDLRISVTLLEDGCATKDLLFNGTLLRAETVQKAYLAGLNGMFANVIPLSELRI